MSIPDVVRRARTEPIYRPQYLHSFDAYACKVFDQVPWNKDDIECEFGIGIPDELAMLWGECSGLVLYEETTYNQGGLVVLSPLEAAGKTRMYFCDREEDTRTGDLIIGRFWGDPRLVLIRSDKSADDYGAIMIVAAMDERSDWYVPELSLESFLVHYMDAHGDDYWDVHYEEILADRAKAQKS